MSEKPDPFVLLSVHYVVSCGNCPFVESYTKTFVPTPTRQLFRKVVMFHLFMILGFTICVFILGMVFGAEIVSKKPEEPREEQGHSVGMPLDRKYREYGGGR